MSSRGAVSAALAGRGNRAEDNTQDYNVILPPLPTGSVVLNTVFLHADVKGRPYRVEDFRDALIRLALLPEVLALGAYQMNHVWAVTFKNDEGKKKMLATPELTVKGRRCIVIDPSHQDVRVKLHWLLFSVADGDVREALAPYGKVIEVAREKWRVDGCQSVGTMTRTAVLRLKAGITCDDIPHQLRVGGELALVVVPGRAPLCLRCQQTGHIRKECRVPRCNVCRRFGHEGAHCVRTYAAAAAPVGGLEKSELLMDEDDAEEAAAGSTDKRSPVANPLPAAENVAETNTSDASPSAGETEHAGQQDMVATEAPTPSGVEGINSNEVNGQPAVDVPMNDADKTAKRTREENVAGPKDSEQEEPPSKAGPLWMRRSTVNANAIVDDKETAKPPP
ncbi:uncharacterized protein ISCGN_004612 [Ixodes scapularis]